MAFQFPDPNVTPEFTGANGITYSWDATDGKWVVKGFAAESVIGPCASSSNTICDQLTELEEEIDAIAPSVERGIWIMTLSGILSSPGLITFYDGTFGNGNPTGLFTAAQSIWFHETDTDGTPHGFNNVEPGNLLELFVQGAAEYGLYEVVEVHDQTHLANPYWAIDVNFVRTLEPSSAAGNGDLIRLKTFQAPTGGTADGFVLKTGDTIPCDNSPISFPNTYIDDDLKMSVSNVQAYVKFTSKNTDDNSTKTVNIFQPGHANAVMTNGNVYSKQDFYGKGLKGFDGTNYRESSVDLSSDTGTLKYGDNRRFFWNSSGGGLSYGSTNIFGWASSGCVAYKPIQMYGDGIATHESHAIHKGYVDDKVEELLARIGELEMAGGVPRNYHFEQVQVREGYNWSGYATGLWLWGDEWDQSSSQPGTSSRKLQIKLPNNSDGSPRWLIKPQGHIIINDFEQYYDQRKVGSIIFYPGKIEVKEYSKSYGPQIYYEITGDFAPTASQYSQYWSRESQVRMTFVGGSVEEVPTP